MSEFVLRQYQENAIVSIFDYFTHNDGNPCLGLPCGTGKSAIIGGFIQRALSFFPKQRFLVVTHVKELIIQDVQALYRMWPTAPIGIYSAGLNKRDTVQPVIYCGIGSIIKNIQSFGHVDLLIIDEAHLLSPSESSMYQRAIAALKTINPYLKVIGFSATLYRLGQGLITDDGLFTDICFDLTGYKEFNKLIADGYICPLIPKRTNTELDVSGVSMNNGDFAKGELQHAVDKQEITYNALKESVEYGYDRKSWLVFASGIEHCEHINEMLQSFGISCATVHSKTSVKDREDRIRAHKQGDLRALIGFKVLTTGYDNPAIDMIVDLYPTMSPGMHVQKLGRLTRPFPGKKNGLVLDFGKNTLRNGPINDPRIPRKKGKATGDAPVKICEACGTYNHASVRFCINCNYEFIFQTKIIKTASSLELIKSDAPIIEYFNVDKVLYTRHSKAGSPLMIKVSYYCGLQKFDEFVCLEHSKFAAKRSRDWWRQRHNSEPPTTTEAALQIISLLRVPKKIRVWVNKQFPEVLNCEF